MRLLSQPWLVACFALLAAAGALLWLARTDAAFVSAVLGVCAWFLNVRAGLKRKHDLVKISGRNYVPRSELEEMEEDDDEQPASR